MPELDEVRRFIDRIEEGALQHRMLLAHQPSTVRRRIIAEAVFRHYRGGDGWQLPSPEPTPVPE